MDAMAYLAYSELMPAYWNINMEQKQLRNDDSIEMLGIIQSNRAFDISNCFGWFSTVATPITDAILAGNTSVSSTVAANKAAIEAAIEKTLTAMED